MWVSHLFTHFSNLVRCVWVTRTGCASVPTRSSGMRSTGPLLPSRISQARQGHSLLGGSLHINKNVSKSPRRIISLQTHTPSTSFYKANLRILFFFFSPVNLPPISGRLAHTHTHTHQYHFPFAMRAYGIPGKMGLSARCRRYVRHSPRFFITHCFPER